MASSFSDLDTHYKIVCIAGGAVGVFITGTILVKLLHRKKKKQYPRDVVILHGIKRGPYAPSLSPYVLKLETYLRVANIPYQMEFGLTPSKKGKWPYIEYNGEVVADSEFCIRYLNSKFNIDLNRHLSVYEKAVADSVKIMSDEHLVWCYAMYRFIFDKDCTMILKIFSVPRVFLWYVKYHTGKILYYQGTGRHSKDEVSALLHRDLTAIQNIIGQNKYLMGERPCEADCAVFGHLAQLYWNFRSNKEMETYLKDTFPSLAAYCERMKTNFWSDWDDCTTRGFTAVAKK